MDSVEGVPQRATLPEQQLFTTYGNLKSFILDEIERLVGDRVRYRCHYTLEVCSPSSLNSVAVQLSRAVLVCVVHLPLPGGPRKLLTIHSLGSHVSHVCLRTTWTVQAKCAFDEIQGIEQVDTATRAITFLKGGGGEEKETWTYDLLVGAEGPLSVIRKVLVKSDKRMKSQLSYIGPMRYVSARSLPVENSTASQAFQRLTSPPDSTAAQSPSGGLQVTGAPHSTLQVADAVSTGVPSPLPLPCIHFAATVHPANSHM